MTNYGAFQCLRILGNRDTPISYDLVFTQDSQRLISASTKAYINIWHLPSHEIIHTLGSPKLAMHCLTLSPDEQFLYGGSLSEIVKWHLPSLTLESRSGLSPAEKRWQRTKHLGVDADRRLYEGHIQSMVIDPYRHKLYLGRVDGTCVHWDIAANEWYYPLVIDGRSRVYSLGTEDLSRVAISRNGEVFVGANGSIMHVFQLAPPKDDPEAQPILRYQTRSWKEGDLLRKATLSDNLSHVIGAMAVSHDGTVVYCGYFGGDIELWRTDRVESLGLLRGHGAKDRLDHSKVISKLALSPDGTVLASAFGTQIRLWDLATLTEITTLTGHPGNVESIAFAPDGQLLASCGFGGIRLWGEPGSLG